MGRNRRGREATEKQEKDRKREKKVLVLPPFDIIPENHTGLLFFACGREEYFHALADKWQIEVVCGGCGVVVVVRICGVVWLGLYVHVCIHFRGNKCIGCSKKRKRKKKESQIFPFMRDHVLFLAVLLIWSDCKRI